CFAGILVSDRFKAYEGWSLSRRQICWAHLMRDFQALAERSGSAGRIGKDLVDSGRKMFRYWHRVRDGTMTLHAFRCRVAPLRRRVEGLLKQGAACFDAKTAGVCLEMLKFHSAFWTFTRVQGVEPTNNAAERALRAAVIWRKTSFGTHSAAGSRFVERMMTVVVSLR